MPEENSGSALMAGNPASNPAAGNGAPAGAPSAPPAGEAPAGDKPAAATGSWYDNIDDADLKGYVQNKGWKDPKELADGYRNLEKLLGGEKIPMPKGADDKEGWARVYDALGRPKTADDYKLQVPEGDDGAFAKVAAGKFHELGLTAEQAAGLNAWWNETQQGRMQEYTQQTAAKSQEDLNNLKTEWGGAYDENLEYGRRAAREYGLDQGKLEKLEAALGTGEMVKLLAQIGRAQGESSFVDGNSGNKGFGMTPEAARQRVDALRADKEWTTKYLQGNADAQQELARLMKLAYPE
jgi:hypothetical protein